jgi:hypothetical protein
VTDIAKTATTVAKALNAEVDRAGCRCERCGVFKHPNALQVHHLTYDHLGNERRGELVVLCNDCHLFVHAYSRSFQQRRSYIERNWKQLHEKAAFLWGRDWWVRESEYSAIERLTPLIFDAFMNHEEEAN